MRVTVSDCAGKLARGRNVWVCIDGHKVGQSFDGRLQLNEGDVVEKALISRVNMHSLNGYGVAICRRASCNVGVCRCRDGTMGSCDGPCRRDEGSGAANGREGEDVTNGFRGGEYAADDARLRGVWERDWASGGVDGGQEEKGEQVEQHLVGYGLDVDGWFVDEGVVL